MDDVFSQVFKLMTIQEIIDYRLINKELTDKYINSALMHQKYKQYGLNVYRFYNNKALQQSIINYLLSMKYCKLSNKYPEDDVAVAENFIFINSKNSYLINIIKDSTDLYKFKNITGLEAMFDIELLRNYDDSDSDPIIIQHTLTKTEVNSIQDMNGNNLSNPECNYVNALSSISH